ncbi:hypothetical protein CHARACLAT_028023, partial [Characodon lateralis]|nr:hypothetical protein [Characodon lateralis]
KSQHKVPKEVLDYKSQSSVKSMEANSTEKQQLQSSEKSKDPVSNVKLQEKAERKAQLLTAPTDSPKSKPTPLYGQPSWWGEDEEQDSTKQNRGGKMPEDDTSGQRMHFKFVQWT